MSDKELRASIQQYADDLRHNRSGGDCYNFAFAIGIADYLEELMRRAPAQAPPPTDALVKALEEIVRKGAWTGTDGLLYTSSEGRIATIALKAHRASPAVPKAYGTTMSTVRINDEPSLNVVRHTRGWGKQMSKDTLIKWGVNAIVVALAACIPLGVFLAFWFNDPHWLVLCAPLLIFLS